HRRQKQKTERRQRDHEHCLPAEQPGGRKVASPDQQQKSDEGRSEQKGSVEVGTANVASVEKVSDVYNVRVPKERGHWHDQAPQVRRQKDERERQTAHDQNQPDGQGVGEILQGRSRLLMWTWTSAERRARARN